LESLERIPAIPETMKTIYFCFGDFRTGEKQYRIFKVNNIDDAYKVADELRNTGYENIGNHPQRESRFVCWNRMQ